MRGHIRPRGKGWSIVISYTDASGDYKQRWFTAYGTRADAERRLTQILGEFDQGMMIEPSKETVESFAARWLADYVEANLKPKTQDAYTLALTNYTLPHIGGTVLQRLTAAQLQHMYANLQKRGGRGGKPLSPKTVHSVHGVLHRMLTHAVKWGVIATNPADAADPPRLARQEPNVWTPEEAARFLRYAESDRLHAMYYLALATGMRRGELLGLRWEDVSFGEGRLAVRYSLVATRAGAVLQDTKTGRAHSIALSPDTLDVLRRHRVRQAEECMAQGRGRAVYVFEGENGGHVQPQMVNHHFGRLVKAAGVPRIRFHDLRHCHATLLLVQGVHPKVVAERLGHSSVNITLNRYSHLLPDLQREAAIGLDKLLRS